jgi:DNA repair protein RecO (recombination protein O)
MTREQRRIQLAPGYILHHRPYRDTSRILEVLTRDHGRITLFARGVRGPKAKLASVLQPFEPLLLSWSGRGESAQLTGAESTHPGGALPPACLMSAFYLNELLLKLTTRHDPLPGLFENYHTTLQALRLGEALAPRLRIFEKRLLEVLGYGIDLSVEAQTGRRIEPDAYYHFRPARGLLPSTADTAGAVAGHSVLCLAAEQLGEAGTLEDARRLLKAALAECLEGRELRTRTVARAIVRREMGK